MARAPKGQLLEYIAEQPSSAGWREPDSAPACVRIFEIPLDQPVCTSQDRRHAAREPALSPEENLASRIFNTIMASDGEQSLTGEAAAVVPGTSRTCAATSPGVDAGHYLHLPTHCPSNHCRHTWDAQWCRERHGRPLTSTSQQSVADDPRSFAATWGILHTAYSRGKSGSGLLHRSPPQHCLWDRARFGARALGTCLVSEGHGELNTSAGFGRS